MLTWNTGQKSGIARSGVLIYARGAKIQVTENSTDITARPDDRDTNSVKTFLFFLLFLIAGLARLQTTIPMPTRLSWKTDQLPLLFIIYPPPTPTPDSSGRKKCHLTELAQPTKHLGSSPKSGRFSYILQPSATIGTPHPKDRQTLHQPFVIPPVIAFTKSELQAICEVSGYLEASMALTGQKECCCCIEVADKTSHSCAEVSVILDKMNVSQEHSSVSKYQGQGKVQSQYVKLLPKISSKEIFRKQKPEKTYPEKNIMMRKMRRKKFETPYPTSFELLTQLSSS